jgi:hypothetical protein
MAFYLFQPPLFGSGDHSHGGRGMAAQRLVE